MKNLKYLLLIIVILSLSKDKQCFAQNFTPEEQHKIDSLNAIITNPNSPDTSLARAYVSLSEILSLSYLDTVIPLCTKAKNIAEKALKNKVTIREKHSLKTNLSASFYNIGFIYKYHGEIVKALEYYHKSLKIREEIGDKKGMAHSLNNIGLIYKYQGKIEKALEYYHKSLKVKEEIGDKEGIAVSLNNIGFIYKNQEEMDIAFRYYNRCLNILEEIGNKEGIAHSLSNIGLIYEYQDKITKALEYYYQSFKVYKEIENKKGIANSLNNIGSIYDNQGEITKALGYYHQSLKIKEEIVDKTGIAISLNKIGVIELKQGKLVSAKQNLEKSLQIAKEIGYPEFISDVSSSLSTVYEKEGKNKLALEMYKLHITMRDSINNEATQKATIQQQAKYEYEKQKAVDDAEHDKQIAIEQEAKEKQQIITYATGGGLGLVGIFLIFVFNRLQVTKKQKLVIETQKVEVEKQKEVVELAHHELEEKNQEIMDSITYAKRIQSAILPPSKLVKEYLQESFILYKPKDIVAGDFYWLEAVSSCHSGLDPESSKNKSAATQNEIAGQASNDDIILFAAADCTGHGVPGAMVSVVCNNGLNRSVREYGLTDPGEILDKTREIVIAEFEKSEDEVKDGMDIALCGLEGTKLKYAGAHNPLWIIRNGELIEIKANKQPIGQFDNPEPYTTHTIELQKGDSFYIFSDGYVDQFGGEKGKKFKTANFKKLLISLQNKNMQKQKQLIDEAFENWKGNLEQLDDVCVIGVKI